MGGFGLAGALYRGKERASRAVVLCKGRQLAFYLVLLDQEKDVYLSDN
jgi:hypothetical protein